VHAPSRAPLLLPPPLSHNLPLPRVHQCVMGRLVHTGLRLVVSRSTCPPLSPSPYANSFEIGAAVIGTHTLEKSGESEAYRRGWKRQKCWGGGQECRSSVGTGLSPRSGPPSKGPKTTSSRSVIVTIIHTTRRAPRLRCPASGSRYRHGDRSLTHTHTHTRTLWNKTKISGRRRD
jgi:hypothetical protein